MKSDSLRVAHLITASRSNGPHLRSVLWVQGCPMRCEGCWNPGFLEFGSGKAKSVAELELALTEEAVEGVTFLGGEPFAQAGPLVLLAERLKGRGLGVMAYSGYTLEQLEHGSEDQRALLQVCDLLVDGLYVKAQAADLLWRGSRNQRVHFLTPRYRDFAVEVDAPYRHFEAFIGADGHMVLTGDPDSDMVELFREASFGRT